MWYISDTWCLSCSVWLIGPGVINITVHSCCCKWHDFLLFFGWALTHWVYVAYLHPFICGWTFQCSQALAIVNGATDIVGVPVSFGRMVFSKDMPTQEWNLGISWEPYFFFEGISVLFPVVIVTSVHFHQQPRKFPFLQALSSIYSV